MTTTKKSDVIAWQRIESCLDNLTPTEGGFSFAQRGIVQLDNGSSVFVKIGTEENSIGWARKEIAVYRYLQAQAYTSIPTLVSTNPGETAFALEPLPANDGWDWSDRWTPQRLDTTLAAMDVLAKMRPQDESWMALGQSALDEGRDGWAELSKSPALTQTLRVKLHAVGRAELAASLDVGKESQRSSRFVFRTDTLVHYDVRADNCAWNASKNEVKFVDWNWLQYGDKRIDDAAMLTHVQKSGLDIRKSHASRLDADALQWLAGFWFRGAATPIWPGGPEHLRDFQLQAGITAHGLARLL